MRKQEDRCIDSVIVLTVICTLSVLLLHHANYTLDFLSPARPFHLHKLLQRFAVGGFIFLSGFKLTKSKLKSSISEFVINRFSKIYGLYFLSVIIFSTTAYPYLNNENFPSIKNTLLHLVALQAILPDHFGNNFHTLWFVSVLLICYSAFLIFRAWLTDLSKFILWVSGFTLSISIIRIIFLQRGIYLFQYDLELWLLIFFAGMINADRNLSLEIKEYYLIFAKFAIIFGLSILLFLYNYSGDIPANIFRIIEIFGALIFLFPSYSLILRKHFIFHPYVIFILKYIAASSYCIFLLHRSIWTVLFYLFSDRTIVQSLFILGLGVPLICLISYLFQSSYTSLTKINTKR
ncbi:MULTISPECIES: acyltransferase [Cyanophyceae]|uniref:acyltransferase family protein n=1 Tax=Cyanophyceae TaxID=3028117 RepID=UPI0002D72D77|nr:MULTISPECIES: acyltransferase [Cyanophyceae]SMH30318.1 Peptidoglycan/LPS O-acetylase OafA/YrhL, contains acyltransferase and SGNH-hydrolase domains [Picosynechococcus sp. OG1]SMQ83876.1 Peptidoglycan/LPS O-acetylase OafA/YrhL, contains acyltransferase and SGNH-hydrolase domains [Synechococcus sp. 7002]